MTVKRIDSDKEKSRRPACFGIENRGKPLSVEKVQRRISALGLATPSEAETMVREDRDSR